MAIAADSTEYLELAPCAGSPNGAYVTGAGSGAMTLDLSGSNTNVDGSGVNGDGTFAFHDVFRICNQSTQEVGVWLDVDPVQQGGSPAVAFYQDSDRSSEVVGVGNAVCLGPGECVCIGLKAQTDGFDAGDELLQPVSNGHEMVVHAGASASCSDPIGGGAPIPGPDPSDGLVGY